MKFSICTAVAILAAATSAASTTTKKSTTTTAAPATTLAPVFGQCGGLGWTGPTKCVSSAPCSSYNSWYHQCVYVG
ncbi:Endoglucanase-4 [Orbilia brochopaga]|nr:Endoglucanase-4 [Drechslerella brochopaga]